jgi:WD40 repeat protein
MEFQKGRPGNVIQLTDDHSYGKSRLYVEDYDLHIEPTWSPDGKELIFVSNRGIQLGSGGLW